MTEMSFIVQIEVHDIVSRKFKSHFFPQFVYEILNTDVPGLSGDVMCCYELGVITEVSKGLMM